MPMIDVYAAAGTFPGKHKLAQDLANSVMRWEKVPPINLFKNNTATFVHELPAEAIQPWPTELGYLSQNRLRADGESTGTLIQVQISSQPRGQSWQSQVNKTQWDHWDGGIPRQAKGAT